MKILQRITTLTILLLALTSAAAQNRYTLSGIITDQTTNEPIIGVAVSSIEQPSSGSVSNERGYFELTLSTRHNTLSLQCLGYKTEQRTVDFAEPTMEVEWQIEPEAMNIDGVVVSATSPIERVEGVQIGAEKVELDKLKKVPALFGQRDIIRSLIMLPGVKAESDASSGFQVRGGKSSQNLILLDHAPIYNAGHVMGLFSMFNDTSVASATLYKGLVDASFGGGTSSVLDVSTRNGSMSGFDGSANIGLLTSSIAIEGPIVEDRASFAVSGRRSYFDMFLVLSEKFEGNIMNFYDINAKLTLKATERNNLSLSYFRGSDNMGLKDMMSMGWDNQSATLQWLHRFSNDLRATTSVYWSDYTSSALMNFMGMDRAIEGGIITYGVRHNYDWQLFDNLSFRAGASGSLIDLTSANWQVETTSLIERRKAIDAAAWVNAQWRVTPTFEASAGVRASFFGALGGAPYYNLAENGDILETLNYDKSELAAQYLYPEPRLSMNWRVSDLHSIKGGYSRSSQHTHAMRNSTVAMPFDRYTMSSNYIKPQIADQFSVGYIGLTPNHLYELTLEAYYKHTDNVYDFRDGKTFSSALEIESLLLGGEGRSYGIESCVKRNFGKFTGWVAYTLSWSENRIAGINDGEWYTAPNDRRHDISIVGIYDITRHWSCSAAWLYNTGQALTAPTAKYTINDENYYYYSERNSYRAPAYHRLDLSVTYTKHHKNYTSEINFGAFNAYHRYNPYMITFVDDATSETGSRAMQYSLFGVVPSVSWGIKF